MSHRLRIVVVPFLLWTQFLAQCFAGQTNCVCPCCDAHSCNDPTTKHSLSRREMVNQSQNRLEVLGHRTGRTRVSVGVPQLL